MTNNTNQILFIDIETCSLSSDFSQLSETSKLLWSQKCKSTLKTENNADEKVQLIHDLYKSKAALYAEFGKVICISVALISKEVNGESLKHWSFCHTNETLVLGSFSNFLKERPQLKYICGHNIRFFDIPFLARRYSILGMNIPHVINLSGKKPWEIKHLFDTMEWWKFGDFKNYTSLALLANIFNIDHGEQFVVSGKDIHELYWSKKDLNLIKKIGESDVRTVFKLYNRMNSKNIEDSYQNQYPMYA